MNKKPQRPAGDRAIPEVFSDSGRAREGQLEGRVGLVITRRMPLEKVQY
jgi:hypothetical protein